MPSSTILVLETTAEATAAIEGPLTGIGYQVSTTVDPADAVRRAAEFALVILDVSNGPRSGVDVCREIRGSAALSAIPVLCLSQSDDVEERVRYLEAGADDVVAKPFDPRELEARVEALLVRFQRSRDLAPLTLAEDEATPHRSIIACFSPKGGVGTTMVAVNVPRSRWRPRRRAACSSWTWISSSARSRRTSTSSRVLTIADLARDDQSIREPDLLRTYTIRHDSGLAVLPAPGTPESGRLITPEQVNLALSTARTAYSTIVIDAGSNLDERSFAVLERAEAVVIPVVPEIGGLKALHSLLEYLTEVGSAAAAATFVLNHLFAREMLSMKQVEAAIGTRIEMEIPYDAGLYLKAINEGIPVVRSAPSSPPARALAKLAAIATGTQRRAGRAARRASWPPWRLPASRAAGPGHPARLSVQGARRPPLVSRSRSRSSGPASRSRSSPPTRTGRWTPAVSTGTPPSTTFVEPGVHGPVGTGTQGIGVWTPRAADVAAITAGFAGELHIPKVGMLAIGIVSAIVSPAAACRRSPACPGTAVSGTGGPRPIVHDTMAALTTTGGIVALPCPTGPGRPALAVSHGGGFPNGHSCATGRASPAAWRASRAGTGGMEWPPTIQDRRVPTPQKEEPATGHRTCRGPWCVRASKAGRPPGRGVPPGDLPHCVPLNTRDAVAQDELANMRRRW